MVPFRRLEFPDDEDRDEAQASGPTPSTSAASGKKRGEHGRHQLSKEVHAIFSLGPNGEPVTPHTVIGTFSNQIGVLVREIVPITYFNWRKVPPELKELVWKGVLLRFNYPADQFEEKKCRKHVLNIAGKALRTFRNKMYTDYVLQNRTPSFERYNFMGPEVWEEFVRLVSTPEFQDKSKQFKDLAKKNDLRHNLGMTGYTGHREEWRREEREAEERGEENPLKALPMRDRDFFYARRPKKAKANKKAKYNDPKVDEVEKIVLEVNEAKERGDFQPRREHDVLTEALGRPEHRGRVRGMGSRYSWKSVDSWQSDATSSFHTRQRYKADLKQQGYQQAMKEMIEKTIQETLTSEDPRLFELRSQMLRQHGLAVQPRQEAAGPQEYPVDRINEHEYAELYIPVGRRGKKKLAATGNVFPPARGAKSYNDMYNMPIPPNYALVEVLWTCPELGDEEIDFPGPRGERRLRDIFMSTLILWNKEDIILKGPSIAPPSQDPPTPPSDDGDNGGGDDDNYTGGGPRSPHDSPHHDMGSHKGGASSPGHRTPPPTSGQDVAHEQCPPTPMKPREAEKDVAGEFEQWKEVFQARAKDVDAQLRQEAGEPPESPLIQTKMPTIQEFEKNFPTKDKEVAAYIDEWDRADEAYKIRKDAQLAKKGEFARERCRR